MFRIAVISLGLLLVAGCVQPPDNPERRREAAELADRFLHAIAGSETDRGWSLLHPSKRDEWGTEREYVEAVEAADWSRFEFTVLEAVYCDDGIWCPVAVDLPNGRDSVPALLHSPDGRQTDGLLFREDRADAGEGLGGDAEIWVVLGDLMRGHETGVFPDPG
jgi:hypothetical protein